MRKFLPIFILFLSISSFAQFNGSSNLRELEYSETEAALREHVAYLSSASLEGRRAGTEGERLAADYLSSILTSYGLDVISGADGETFGLKQEEKGDTLTSRNVLAYIPGYDPKLKDHYIVIGARLDNLGYVDYHADGQKRTKIYYGANGNGSGLAMLVELAKMLNTNSVLLRRSVIIAAFGATGELSAGAWYFLNRSFSDVAGIDAFINLDMLGTPSRGFYAYTASNTDLNAVVSKLGTSIQPIHPTIVSAEPVSSCHRSFYEKQIPSVFFTSGMYPEYNTDRDTASILEYEDMERELAYIYNFTLKLVNGGKPEFYKSKDTGKTLRNDDDIVPYSECDIKPYFLNSSDPTIFLRKWVYTYLKYPRSAAERGDQGRVLLNFTIDAKGKVGDVRVVKGICEELDDEAVRVVSASPNWKPGRLKGKKVKTELSLYVEFRLKQKKAKRR